MITADPNRNYESCLLGRGAAHLSGFAPQALADYRAAWRKPDTIAAMCQNYRAVLDLDNAQDAADLHTRIACPALVMWGTDGIMGQAYDVPATWSARLNDITAAPIPDGHFFVDQSPAQTAKALLDFPVRLGG